MLITDRSRPSNRFGRSLLLAFALCMGRAVAGPLETGAGEKSMPLPKQVGVWRLMEGPRRVEPKAIFDYMDGGGELYLGYRLRHLDVYDYRDAADTQILLEIYRMETSDDAFGLLSLDSDGQAVTFGNDKSPFGRGIYGAGLLRLWSGDMFVRILAEKETPGSRDAVMQLGRAATEGRTAHSPPEFLQALPAELARYQLNRGEVSFLRSYLVLNSLYFLSTRNILKLDLRTEAVTASYRTGSAGQTASFRLLEVRYESPASALAGFRSFIQSYLPERKCEGSSPAASRSGAQPSTGTCVVEDGWVGYRVVGRTLVLAFQLPSEQTARLCLDEAAEQLHTWEKSHE